MHCRDQEHERACQHENSCHGISPGAERSYHLRLANSQGDHRDVVDAVHRCDQDGRDRNNVFEPAARNQYGSGRSGEQQRRPGGTAQVDLCGPFAKQPIAANRQQNARRSQQNCVD